MLQLVRVETELIGQRRSRPLLVGLQQREGVVVQVGEGVREARLEVRCRVLLKLLLLLLLLLLLFLPLFLLLLLHGVNGVELRSIQLWRQVTSSLSHDHKQSARVSEE